MPFIFAIALLADPPAAIEPLPIEIAAPVDRALSDEEAKRIFQDAIHALDWVRKSDALSISCSASLWRSPELLALRLAEDEKEWPHYDDEGRMRIHDLQSPVQREVHIRFDKSRFRSDDAYNGFLTETNNWVDGRGSWLRDADPTCRLPSYASIDSNRYPAQRAVWQLVLGLPYQRAFQLDRPSVVDFASRLHGEPNLSRMDVVAQNARYLGETDFDGEPCHVFAGSSGNRVDARTWFVHCEDGQLRGHWLGLTEERYLDWLRAGGNDQYKNLSERLSQRLEYGFLYETRLRDWQPTPNGHSFPREFVGQTMTDFDDATAVSETEHWLVYQFDSEPSFDDSSFVVAIPEGTPVREQQGDLILKYRYKSDLTPDEWEAIRGEALARNATFDEAQRKLQSRIGAAAPPLVGEWYDGKKRSWEDFRGKYVMLVAYSIHCGPCQGSPKWIEDIEFQRRNLGGISARAICIQNAGVTREELESHFDRTLDGRVRFPILIDQGERSFSGPVFEALGNPPMPSVWVVGPEGKLVGHAWIERDAEQLVREHAKAAQSDTTNSTGSKDSGT